VSICLSHTKRTKVILEWLPENRGAIVSPRFAGFELYLFKPLF
jgi:hypothetical protein